MVGGSGGRKMGNRRQQARKESLEKIERLQKGLAMLHTYIKKDQITEGGFKRFRTRVHNAFWRMNGATRAYYFQCKEKKNEGI